MKKFAISITTLAIITAFSVFAIKLKQLKAQVRDLESVKTHFEYGESFSDSSGWKTATISSTIGQDRGTAKHGPQIVLYYRGHLGIRIEDYQNGEFKSIYTYGLIQTEDEFFPEEVPKATQPDP